MCSCLLWIRTGDGRGKPRRGMRVRSRPLPTVLVNSKGIGKHLLKLEVGHIQSAVGGGVVGGKSRPRGIPVPQHVQIEIV